ncbi:hypothetical protein KS2013_1093 [Kangiella sediminilitoris]|uniref:Tail specific protease domain-containing protein n=2 Tax=Kangiella sediminilitoris TaxID=1144748 RepID=A0A1B3BAJ5_9GAMM|nr:hypothetical protein KS2013_1093 [Kangiella sediminilitoris]
MFLSIVVALTACINSSHKVSSTSNNKRLAIFQDGVVVNQAQGIWLSEEYGWLLNIGNNGIERWQYTQDYCYPSPQDADTFMGSVEYRFITRLSQDIAKFEYLKSDGNTIYQKLDMLPKHCDIKADFTQTELLQVFISIFKKHYTFFQQRGVDFHSAADLAQQNINDESSDSELYQAMTDLIKPLNDSHTKLLATINGNKHRYQNGLGQTLPFIRDTIGETPWLIGLIEQTVDLLDDGAEHTANDRVLWGTLNNGKVGYIKIFTMGGFTTEFQPGTQQWAEAELEYMDQLFGRIMLKFQTVDSVIIDLSNNRGGYDAIARKLSSYFTDKAFLAYSVSTSWEELSPYEYWVSPADGPRYTGPVSVLTSDVTVSGGEIATMTLRQLPNVKHMGQTTRGAFSTPLAKPLPNDWYLELSNEIFKAPNGVSYEGKGIEPSEMFDVFNPANPVKSHAQAVKKAIRLSP